MSDRGVYELLAEQYQAAADQARRMQSVLTQGLSTIQRDAEEEQRIRDLIEENRRAEARYLEARDRCLAKAES